jgi:diguanylate cyclase (GGDEF)-like protein/PAS domain S-box-containing protein
VVKYATDITAERLRQADYQWQISAINRSHAVVTFDMHGVVLDANALFIEAMGYSAEEIIGSHHRVFVEPAYAHGAEYAAFWRGLQRGRHHAGQYKRIAKDGSSVWLQASYNPIFDARNCLVKVVKYATIVTEERLQQADHQGQIAAIHQAQCVISFDLDGTIVDANDNFLDAVGYRYSEVRGQHHSMFVDPETAAGADYAGFWKMLSAGQHHAGEYKRIGRDGREIWLQATYNPILDMNGQPFKVVKYATDVTLQKLQQADYQGQIEAVNKSQGVVELALDGTILSVNDNFLETLGYAIEDIRGQPHQMLIEPGLAEQQDYIDFWNTLRAGKYHSGLYKRIGKGGRELWIQASYNPILDLNGTPVRVMKFATDVTSNIEMAEAYADASRQAQHDAATSLPNRVKLASFMTEHLSVPAARMTVFYLDLDRFKPINDTFGHHVGDRVLGEIADRLRRQLRPDQIVARVGGDEFVIAAPDLPLEEVEDFAKRLIDVARSPIRHEDGEISVGISLGIAFAPTDGTAPDQLLRAADAALYQSKQNGRGSYSFFALDMNDRIVAERRLADEMRRALTLEQFFLEYQPRFDTRGRAIRSVEALVRWAHPERGRVSPVDFVPLAERNGLIVPMGEWILNTACKAATEWGDVGVSVNVSPIQFRDGDLVATVAAALASSGLEGHRLELEITEGVLLDDSDRALSILNGLKRLGVKLAMDDFGTGYSSLSYLRNFPFDVIKIDRGFIADMEAEGSSRSIVQAILGLGKALGLSVTAEGVETNEQLAMLSMDQCSEVQGFLLARPLDAAKVSELLTRLPELTLAKAS